MAAPTVRPMRQIMDNVQAYATLHGDPTVHYFGAEHLPEALDAGNRCVWVPTNDTPSGSLMGASTSLGPGYVVVPKPIKRSLGTFAEGIAIHIWGTVVPPFDAVDPDVYRDAAYFMRNNVIVALRNVLNANYQIANSGWYQPKSEALAVYGRVYVLNFSSEIPIPDSIIALTTIRSMVLSMYGTPPDGATEQDDQDIAVPGP